MSRWLFCALGAEGEIDCPAFGATLSYNNSNYWPQMDKELGHEGAPSAGGHYLLLHFNLWLFSRFSSAAFLPVIYYVEAECGSDRPVVTLHLSQKSRLVLNQSHMHIVNGSLCVCVCGGGWGGGGFLAHLQAIQLQWGKERPQLVRVEWW